MLYLNIHEGQRDLRAEVKIISERYWVQFLFRTQSIT